MNFELFITKRSLTKDKDNISGPYINIAVIAIALGLAVMIISVAIVTGFQHEIRNKVIGFGSHIQVTSYDFNRSVESTPIEINPSLRRSIEAIDGVVHTQVFASKAGIVKANDAIQGIVMKGIGSDYDWSFFKDKIKVGNTFQIHDSAKTNFILISGKLADKLDLNIGDDLRVYFVGMDSKQPRGRKFLIHGIYETGLEEFDESYIIGDIGHIRQLNNWNDNQIAGYEILIDDFDNVESLADQVYGMIDYDLRATHIKEMYPQIFDWLNLQDMNVVVIIVLMILVAGITMVSTLLVLILERTNTIGLLKAMGARNKSIRKIFIYNSIYIIGIGMFWGNIAGVGMALLQDYTRLIPLSEESYYVSYVPVQLDLTSLILLNIGTLVVCTLMLLIPSHIVSRITPMKAIRFD